MRPTAQRDHAGANAWRFRHRSPVDDAIKIAEKIFQGDSHADLIGYDSLNECEMELAHMLDGGRWTRPDITLASSNEYRYVPGRLVELRTFEVKTYDGLDVTAVYEALSHRRAAHVAHVLVHVPECERSGLKSILHRVIGDAEEYGIGVTTLSDPQDYKTWRVEVDARRANPDPADVNAFIRAQTGGKFKDKILSWCRRV